MTDEEPHAVEKAADLPTDSAELLRQLFGDNPPALAVTLFKSFRGPLPDPDTLRAYKEIDPALLATIVREFQAEASHRRSIEVRQQELAEYEIRQGFRQARLGVFVAAVVAIAGFIAAV